MKKNVIIIRRSCLTGKAVWLFRSKSRRAAASAYCLAKKMEYRQQKRWPDRVRQWQEWMLDALNDWLRGLPVTQELTAEQIRHVRAIQAIVKEDIPRDRDFYSHIITEARRRNPSKTY